MFWTRSDAPRALFGPRLGWEDPTTFWYGAAGQKSREAGAGIDWIPDWAGSAHFTSDPWPFSGGGFRIARAPGTALDWVERVANARAAGNGRCWECRPGGGTLAGLGHVAKTGRRPRIGWTDGNLKTSILGFRGSRLGEWGQPAGRPGNSTSVPGVFGLREERAP